MNPRATAVLLAGPVLDAATTITGLSLGHPEALQLAQAAMTVLGRAAGVLAIALAETILVLATYHLLARLLGPATSSGVLAEWAPQALATLGPLTAGLHNTMIIFYGRGLVIA